MLRILSYIAAWPVLRVCVFACVGLRACVLPCVRARDRACACACVRVSAHARVCAYWCSVCVQSVGVRLGAHSGVCLCSHGASGILHWLRESTDSELVLATRALAADAAALMAAAASAEISSRLLLEQPSHHQDGILQRGRLASLH